jgi:predicted lactoylglutathione lyase
MLNQDVSKNEEFLTGLGFTSPFSFTLEKQQKVIVADIWSQTFFVSDLESGDYHNFDHHMKDESKIDTVVAKLLAAGWEQTNGATTMKSPMRNTSPKTG